MMRFFDEAPTAPQRDWSRVRLTVRQRDESTPGESVSSAPRLCRCSTGCWGSGERRRVLLARPCRIVVPADLWEVAAQGFDVNAEADVLEPFEH